MLKMLKTLKALKTVALLLALSLLMVGCATGSATDAPGADKDDPAADDNGGATDDGEPSTMTLRVASFNIKYGAAADFDLSKIADIIKELDLDIVGIQEVDYKTTRSGSVDQPAVIAELAGMEYYQFYRCIDYRGGEYGTLILSKYPIKRTRLHTLESGDKEQRALGYAKIDVNGTTVDFFNTHLSYESKELRAEQTALIKEIMSDRDSFILMGDLNTDDFTEFDLFGGTLINRQDRAFVTFPKYQSSIDNIIFSERYTEKDAGVYETSYSDHNVLWAEFSFTVK